MIDKIEYDNPEGLPKLPDDFIWKCYTEADFDGDYSWLGTFANRLPDETTWYVDRINNTLLLQNSEESYDTGILPIKGRNRFFIPSENHNLPGEKWGDHISAEVLAEIIEKYGSTRDADIQYMLQDYQRAEGLLTGDWSFIGHIVELWFKHERIQTNSVWNTESDCGDEHSDTLLIELAENIVHTLRKVGTQLNASEEND